MSSSSARSFLKLRGPICELRSRILILTLILITMNDDKGEEE